MSTDELCAIVVFLIIAGLILFTMLTKEERSANRNPRHIRILKFSDGTPVISQEEYQTGYSYGDQRGKPEVKYRHGAVVGRMAGVNHMFDDGTWNCNNPIPGAQYYVQVQTSEDDKRMNTERLVREAYDRLENNLGGPLMDADDKIKTIYIPDPNFTPDPEMKGRWGWQVLEPAPDESLRHAAPDGIIRRG